MLLEDKVVIRFEVLQGEFQAALKQIGAGLQSVGATSPQINRATQGMAQMGRQVQQNTRHMHGHNRAADQASGLLQELNMQTGNMGQGFRKAALSIQSGVTWLDKFSIQADRASMTAWKFVMAGTSLQQLAAVTGSVAVGMGLVTKKMVDSFSMVDRIKRQFSSIYQSAELGGKMVDQLVDDAVKIRYSVEQVLDAGRLLALEGFNPKDLIYDMADLAAGVNQEGISIVNATRAFVDATNGQFRRLKETFQVTRDDAMAFAPDAFGGPNNQISNQAKATEAIIRAIKAKYRGMNEATMQTIGGTLSNVDDAMTKATAKMGAAIEQTVVGWLGKLMGLFDSIGKFAETDLGKATANTVLWSTAISVAVTGLALLASGLVTVLGLFAAYKVFMEARGGGMKNVIDAELKLLAVNRLLAEMDAADSMKSINLLQAKLTLTTALRAEEEKRLALLAIQRSGGDVAGAQAGVSTAVADVAKARAQVAVQTIPREIVGLEQAADASRAITAQYMAQIQAQTLGAELQTSQLTELQGQLVIERQITAQIEAQIAAKRVLLTQAERVAGVTAAGTATMAAQTGGTFAGGVGAGAGAVAKGIGGLFGMLVAPINGLVTAISSAVAAAGGLAATVGVITGVGLAIGVIIAAGWAVKHVLDEDAKSLRIFRSGLDASIVKLKSWTDTLPTTPEQRAASERAQEGLKILGKIGKQGSFGSFQGGGQLIKDFFKNATWLQTMPYSGGPRIPGMADRFALGKKTMDASQGDIGIARQMISDMVAATRSAGHGLPKGMKGLNAEKIASMSEEDIRKLTVTEKQRQVIAADVDRLYKEQNASLTKQGEQADRNARRFAETQLRAKDLTAEQKAFYEQVVASTSPAQILSKSLHEGFKHAQDALPEIQDIAEAMEKASDEGKVDAETKATLAANLEVAKKSLAEMEQSQDGLAKIGLKLSIDEQKTLDATREKVRLLERQTALYDAIRKLMEDQKRLGLAQSAGMGNLGAVFGSDMSAGETAAAQATTNAKERQRHQQAALEWRRKAIDDETRQSLDMGAPGVGSSVRERAEYERYQAQRERERMRRVAGEYQPLISGADSSGQRQRLQRQLDVETAVSERSAKERESAAENMLLEERIGLLEVERQKRLQSVESEAALLKYDMKILNLKQEQARATGDEVAVQRISVEKAEARRRAEELTNQLLIERLGIEKQALELEGATVEDVEKNAKATHDAYLKEAERLRRQGKTNEAAKAEADANSALRSSREEILNIEEERLRYLEEQAAMGKATPEDVEAQRQKLAKQYEDEAGKYKPGSREEMKYKTQAAEARGDIDLDQAIAAWEAYRREQAMTTESEADLLQIDLQILDLKEQQAKIAGDEAAVRDIEAQKREAQIEAERVINQLYIERLELDKQMLDITGATVDEITANMQAQYQAHMQEAARLRALGKNNEAQQEEVAANAVIKSGREEIVGTEEDRLRLLEKQAERGMATPEQVAQQREGVAKQYEWMAGQYKPGSAENMAWQERAMDMRGGGIDDQIAAWEAYRRETALTVESEAELLDIDLSILDLNERQAKIAGDENAIKDIQVQKTERRRQAEESINQLLMERLNIEKQQMDTHGATQADIEKNMQDRYKAKMDDAAKARREGRPVEAAKHEADADAIVKQGRGEILGIEEQRLRLLEAQRRQGLVGDRDVAAQRNKTVSHYRWLASQFKPGSAENMRYEEMALGVEGEQKDKSVNDAVGRLEAERNWAAANGASEQQLLGMDKAILDLKMKTAIANKDITGWMNLQVDAANRLKQSQESAIGAEQAKLSYMQEMADQGLISQDAVEMEKRALAAMYQNRAKQAAVGSAEYYNNMQQALSLLGDETQDKWQGIIGTILGAPQSLLEGVLSNGWIAQQLGDAANALGMGDRMKADIVNQSNRSITVRVDWANLDAVSNRVEAALPPAMSAFAKEFTHALGAA